MIFINQDGLPLYLLDRSRLEGARECPREYYWRYGFLGVGIIKNKEIPPYWPFHTGTYIHEGIESILKGISGREAAETAASNYWLEFAGLLGDPDISPERQALLQLELMQETDLVRGLVYGWSLVGYPRLIANYEVVEGGIEQEEEISWLVSDGTPGAPESEVKLMTRTDILARSRQSNGAMIFNLKSVSDPDERWRSSFTRDMQTLTEAMAAEARLGVKVEGVIIEGLVKGKRNEWPKGSGFWQHNNMLIYAWVKDSTDSSLPGEQGGMEYATSWDYTCSAPHVMGNNQRCPGGRNHTLGKGFRKRPVRDCFPGGVYSWVDYLNRTDAATLESYFVQLQPISRDEFQVERWKRQKLHAEKSRQDAASLIDAAFLAGDKDTAYTLLDHYFDMYEGYQCHSCTFHDICWAGASPFDESLWKPRIPNHLLEAKMLASMTTKVES